MLNNLVILFAEFIDEMLSQKRLSISLSSRLIRILHPRVLARTASAVCLTSQYVLPVLSLRVIISTSESIESLSFLLISRNCSELH